MYLKFWTFIWTKFIKKITAIKLNKLKFKKVLKKITFSFSKVIFSLLEKKIFLIKVDFYFTFVHMNVQNFRHIYYRKYYLEQVATFFMYSWVSLDWHTAYSFSILQPHARLWMYYVHSANMSTAAIEAEGNRERDRERSGYLQPSHTNRVLVSNFYDYTTDITRSTGLPINSRILGQIPIIGNSIGIS